MSWSSKIRSLFKTSAKKMQINTKSNVRLVIENLEERVMPYSVTGNAWPDPKLITISFMPDGTQMSSSSSCTITSNMFSTMNAKFGSPAVWETQILRAAQVWAQQTNINFSVVPDDGAPSGSGNNEQGDPGFGDIRIGGYSFGNSTLAMAFQPPPANNYSLAGDIAFNTSQTWNIGTTYDLFTVAAHEMGHALGMDHSSSGSTAIMYSSYSGIKNTLSSDDIAGIRNIYSSNAARTADAYDAGNGNNMLTTATNVSSLINSNSLTALVNNLDLSPTSDLDYYTFTAPAGTTGTMQVQVQSQGLSLLTPKVTVYAANGTTALGSASGVNQYGTTLDVNVTGVTAGTQYYVKVQGADTTSFSTGAYALALNFASNATPVAPSPMVTVAAGTTHAASGGIADNPNLGDQLLGSTPLITGVSPDRGSSSNDGVTNATKIVFSGTGPVGSFIRLYQMGVNGAPDQLIGTTLTVATLWNFDYTNHPLSDGIHIYYTRAVSLLGGISNPSTTYSVVIDTIAPNKPIISGITSDTGASSLDGVTNTNSPTLVGTAEANSTVTVYQNGLNVGTAAADSSGNWQFVSQALPNGSYAFTTIATDLAGNTSPSSAPFNVTIDTTAPAAPALSGVTQNNANGQQILAIGGVAAAGSTVTMYLGGNVLGSVVADPLGNWTYTDSSSNFSNGNYVFSATSTDLAGNISATSKNFTLGLGGQTQTLATPQLVSSCVLSMDSLNNPITTSTPTLTGNAWANTVVTILDGNTILGTAVVNASGQWQFTCPSLSKGKHNLRIEDTTTAGLTGLESDVLTITV